MSGARETLAALYDAAIGGADPESLTADAVAGLPLEGRHRVWVFAMGKAADAMARGAVSTLQRSLAEICGGLVVGAQRPTAPCGTVAAVAGDHPVPGRRSFAASDALERTVRLKRGTDLGLVLLSGGASSLIGAPLRGIADADFVQLWQLLLASGMDIERMNAVRKRFSFWAAGRMALGLAPARGFCFAMSDVPGDDLATIGSGPCVPDPTRADDVLALLREAGLLDRVAPSIRQYLADVSRGGIPETPKHTHPAFAHMSARVIGGSSSALAGVATAARQRGFDSRVHPTPLTGDAREAGVRVAEALLAERATGNGGRICVAWGGETTVPLGDAPPRGGRCQELALAAARRLAEARDLARGITLLAAGTDGRDGTTDAAGAFVDHATWRAVADAGVDPVAALAAHEAHRALSAAGALFSPGHTGTNVMDVVIATIDRGG